MKLQMVLLFIYHSSFAVAAPAQERFAVQERPAIKGIAFVWMDSADMAASDAFYEKTLGFKKLLVPMGLRGTAVNSSQWLEVIAGPIVSAKATTRMPLVAFTTRDLGAIRTHLAAHQIVMLGERSGGG